MPPGLDESAFQSGALVRRREVQSASCLMRLVMAYAVEGRSLRQTAAWASAAGVARLSDVALLKRLKASSSWLGVVLAHMLAERARLLGSCWSGLKVHLVDATGVSRPGSKGTDWRLHMRLDLGSLLVEHVELTDARGGETLTRHTVGPEEVLIGDRGYAHRRGIYEIASQGGYVLVRLNWQNLPLLDMRDRPVDILALVRQMPRGEVLDLPVQTAPGKHDEPPAVPGRLVAVRKSEQAAERARRNILSQAKKRGRTPDQRTLEAAEYLFVFATLPAERVGAAEILELYRFRWQIELAFKRLKGILEMDEMSAKDEELCRTFLLAKIIAALLVEELARAHIAFSPWGYGTPASPVAMEGLSDGL